MSPAPSGFEKSSEWLKSEDQLQSELNVAWTSRSKHRVGTGRIRRVKDIPETCAATCPRRIDVIRSSGAARPPVWINEIRVVEKIEDFGPELGAEAFRDLDILAHGRIHVSEASVAPRIAAHRAKTAVSRWDQNRIPQRIAS